MSISVENQTNINEVSNEIATRSYLNLRRISTIGLLALVGTGGVFISSIKKDLTTDVNYLTHPVTLTESKPYLTTPTIPATSKVLAPIYTNSVTTTTSPLPEVNYSIGPILPIGNFPKINQVKLDKIIFNNEKIITNEHPPFTVEEFAATTIAELALQKNIPIKNALTQDHLNALITWMWAEGGDINNNNKFNPLNTGINLPKYIAGQPNYNGNQSFKSYRDGIMATVLTLSLPQFSRLANCLLDKNTTTTDFFNALTNYQQYPNNVYWAQSDTNNSAMGWSQNNYLNNLMTIAKQVKTNYTHYAGLEIGVGPLTEKNNISYPQKVKNASGYLYQFTKKA